MVITVISDSHGDTDALRYVFQKERSCDLFIFLGDGDRDIDILRAEMPYLPVISVAGNCDRFSLSGADGIYNADGVKIYFTHGHNHHVKESLLGVMMAARSREAKIALFGHTHEAGVWENDGVTLVNPGSISRPRSRGKSYAKIVIKGEKIDTEIVNLYD